MGDEPSKLRRVDRLAVATAQSSVDISSERNAQRIVRMDTHNTRIAADEKVQRVGITAGSVLR